MQHCGIHSSFWPDLLVWQEAGGAGAQWPILILGGPANMSPAHPQVVKPLGITSGKIPDSAINATSERGNYEARNIRYVENPSSPAGPCLSWQSCVTLLRSRLFCGPGRLGLIISLRALPRRLHTRRAPSMPPGQCTTACMYPHLSLPLITTPPPIEQCNRELFGGSICTYSLWLMPCWRGKTCLPTRLLFTRV